MSRQLSWERAELLRMSRIFAINYKVMLAERKTETLGRSTLYLHFWVDGFQNFHKIPISL